MCKDWINNTLQDHQNDTVTEDHSPDTTKTVYVFNKVDTVSSVNELVANPPQDHFYISCSTGQGLEHLESSLTKLATELVASSSEKDPSQDVLITRERHRRHLLMCVEHLDHFLSARLPMDLAAEELR